jgi:hypothetical protein
MSVTRKVIGSVTHSVWGLRRRGSGPGPARRRTMISPVEGAAATTAGAQRRPSRVPRRRATLREPAAGQLAALRLRFTSTRPRDFGEVRTGVVVNAAGGLAATDAAGSSIIVIMGPSNLPEIMDSSPQSRLSRISMGDVRHRWAEIFSFRVKSQLERTGFRTSPGFIKLSRFKRNQTRMNWPKRANLSRPPRPWLGTPNGRVARKRSTGSDRFYGRTVHVHELYMTH